LTRPVSDPTTSDTRSAQPCRCRKLRPRVAAYFVASKDQNNELKTIAKPKASPLSYIESVAWSLWDGFSDYGLFHADPFGGRCGESQ
jgi:hypothetical protein